MEAKHSNTGMEVEWPGNEAKRLVHDAFFPPVITAGFHYTVEININFFSPAK